MILIPVVFLAINIAFPVWLWSGTSTHPVKVEWTALEKNIARLIESEGGFAPCSTLHVVDVIHDLCNSSQEKLLGKDSVAVERAGKDVVFACEFRKDGILINWYKETSSGGGELDCADPGEELLTHSPGFFFVKNGRMKAMEFVTAAGKHQTVPYRNCRAKAAKLSQLTEPIADEHGFLQALGKMAGDPDDFITANEMCLLFDSSPLWRPWRDKFLD